MVPLNRDTGGVPGERKGRDEIKEEGRGKRDEGRPRGKELRTGK